MKYIFLLVLLTMLGCAECVDENLAKCWTAEEQCQFWNKWSTGDRHGTCS